MPRLQHDVAVRRGDGSYTRLPARLTTLDLLAIDDWRIAPLRDAERLWILPEPWKTTPRAEIDAPPRPL